MSMSLIGDQDLKEKGIGEFRTRGLDRWIECLGKSFPAAINVRLAIGKSHHRQFLNARISDVLCGIVGNGSRLILSPCKTHVYNADSLHRLIKERPQRQPLITVCNHTSTFDDPGLWGAEEILFTNPLYRFIFGYGGQVIPIVRGAGLNQPGVQRSIELLNEGKWVHLFPEGHVNQSGKLHPLRWGVGKLVESANVTPVVLPFYHLGITSFSQSPKGMEKILPEGKLYIPRPFGKTIGIVVGEPLYFDQVLEEHRRAKSTPSEIHSDITNQIQKELLTLEDKIKSFQQFWKS